MKNQITENTWYRAEGVYNPALTYGTVEEAIKSITNSILSYSKAIKNGTASVREEGSRLILEGKAVQGGCFLEPIYPGVGFM